MSVRIYSICLFLCCLLSSYSSMGQAFNQSGLKAIYYKSPEFKDSLLTRRDAEINFDWTKQKKGLPGSLNKFSVKWLGYVVPLFSDQYRFYVQTDGDVSLWVNDSLIINRSNLKDSTSLSGTLTLTKGIQYSFKMQSSKASAIKLEWQSSNQKREVIPSTQLIPEGAELPPVRVMMNVIGRDPEVTLGPDGNYYLVHTSCYLEGKLAHKNCWDNNDGLRLWKSTDLKNWTDLGLVWSIEKDGTWQKEFDAKGRRPLWAPEIHYINKMKNWYMVYSMGTFDPQGIRTGLMKSTSGKPEGPYENVVESPITEGIDGSLYEENGKVYFLRNHCLIALMNNEMTGFVEPFKPLQTFKGENVGFEGSGIFKYKGKYFLYSAKSNEEMGKNTYDLNIAVADNIYGPYSNSWMALRHGGHSTVFTDKKGTIWATMFGADDVSNVFITPSLVQLQEDVTGKLLPVRGNARSKVILPTQEIEPVIWKYTFEKPPMGWSTIGFNDKYWLSGLSGFGVNGKTSWKTDDIWLRKSFNPGTITGALLENMVLNISHNADVEVYINGVEACVMSGFNKYSLKKISSAAKKSIKSGKLNTIAIHCKKEGEGQFLDAGLITWTAF